MTAMPMLTHREAQLLAAIVALADAGEPAPTNLELVAALRLQSDGHVAGLMGRLAAKGYVRLAYSHGGHAHGGRARRRIEIVERIPAAVGRAQRTDRAPTAAERALDDPALQARAIALYVAGSYLSDLPAEIGIGSGGQVLARLRRILSEAGALVPGRRDPGSRPAYRSRSRGEWPADAPRFQDSPRAARPEPPLRGLPAAALSLQGNAAALCVAHGDGEG